LRQCKLRHGVVDQRALEIRDDQREAVFAQYGTARYEPVSRLPAPGSIGLPPAVADALDRWAAQIQSAPSLDHLESLPRRMLISGRDGLGKATLARSIGAALGRPIVQIEALRCLRGKLGESEDTLRAVLRVVNALHACVVLIDDVDRFFFHGAGDPAARRDSPGFKPTLSRMASILLRWFDEMAPGAVAVCVAQDAGRLSPEWRRRMDLRFDLKVPSAAHGSVLEYRSRVFAALFRKYRLEALASDGAFISRLASRTDPAGHGAPVLSPMSRFFPGQYPRVEVKLETGSEIEAWIAENIMLGEGERQPVRSPDFWSESAS
jgi:SpoVK/Ycf46/Vps4 family AAA+-type ATPase